MYPSAFCQPSFRQSSCGNESWTRRTQRHPASERSYANLPFITLHSPSHIHRTHHASHDGEIQRNRERELHEHHQSLARATRRQFLAQRAHERYLAHQQAQRDALRGFYLAEREARVRARMVQHEVERRRRMREERASFVELVDELLNGITRSVPTDTGYSRTEEQQESTPARQFSDSESEADDDDEDRAMRGLLDSFLHRFVLRDDALDLRDAPPQETSPPANPHAQNPVGSTSTESHHATTQESTAETLDAIHQAYTANSARVERLESLDALHQKLVDLIAGFTFPPHLDFQHPHSDSASAPPDSSLPGLTYTSTNAPFHAHAQSLLGLLVEADAVQSDGDPEVRTRRKEFVRLVEAELDALDGGKVRAWEGQKGGV